MTIAPAAGASTPRERRPALACVLPIMVGLGVLIAGCTGAPNTSATVSSARSSAEAVATAGTSVTGPQAAGASPPASEAQSPTAGKASGDVPDNAVFLTYRDITHRFSIQYVEGWEVVTGSYGVQIRDKDSSETVQLTLATSDVATYVARTDLPALRRQAGFALVRQDFVRVGGRPRIHLSYHLLAPPNPVTGKQVLSIVDRYYLPGANSLAIVSLSTPDGVDNADAFRRMIESYRWT